MNPSDLQTIKTIITHDNCSDGLASAILLHDALPNAEIRFVQYGTAEYQTLQAGPNMMFVDFSPPVDRAQEFIDDGAYILDHHKTAKNVVARFGERGIFGDEVKDPGVCGAVLAYREVWLPLVGHPNDGSKYLEFVEKFARLAGVRDTWQRQSPEWNEALIQHQILTFMPKERWLSKTLVEIAAYWDSQFRWIGEVLLEHQDKVVQKAVDGARRFRTEKGTRVVLFEGVKKTSDAAELLDNQTDLVMGFNYFEENAPDGSRITKIIYSTRSHTTYDCSALAKFYGGGGHTKAAGFNCTLVPNDLNPYDMACALITAFELNSSLAK